MAAKSMSQTKLATPLAAALAVCAALAIPYAVLTPASTDLAAQAFRAELFADSGPLVWSEAWYGGFHLPGYSFLFPPLAALVGVHLTGALTALGAAGLFALLAQRRSAGRAALIGSVWFALGAGAWLYTGRLTFLLGVTVGLGALLAADLRRPIAAGALATLTALASPVAGVFVAVAGIAVGLAGARRAGAALALPAAAATMFAGLAFPTTGEAPFTFSSFVAVPLFVAGALLVVPREQRAVRIGIVLYGLLALAVFAIPNPLGGNVVRLGALFGGPLAALCLRSPALLLVVAAPLLYWQLDAPVRDARAGAGDPATEAAFFEPLLDQLDRRGIADGQPMRRIHIPPTANRWEAVHVGERLALARGWLRQLESDDFELFDNGNLTPAAYATWLEDHGVSYVAVPDAELDWIGRDEVALIDSGLPFLEPIWEEEDWRLYRVDPEPPLVSAIAGPEAGADRGSGRAPSLRRLGPGRFELDAETGHYLVRLAWTPYWELDGARACASEEAGWTRIDVAGSGTVELAARFRIAGLGGRERICSG
ncbi:MAG TPA: hypothetical protein VK919_02585 [Solirubrobacterales bacterium]|nr:hypothetical protein [Solirubrobacterales bacterium]